MLWLAILESGDQGSPIPDADDLEGLMSAYERLLFTIAIGILGKTYREDAEECVADAFLGYWRIRQASGTVENVKAYLAVSVKHLALNRLKKLKRRRYAEITEEVPDFLSLSPEEAVMESANGIIVREVLESLPAVEREIWLRRYFWCQPVKEIARQMGLKPKLVENRLYAGKKAVRQGLLDRHINL